MIVAGMRVGVRDTAAAVGEGGRVTGVCAQERVTRVRGGPTPDGFPNEALDLLLQRAGRTRADLGRIALVDGGGGPVESGGAPPLTDHFAHACTAHLTSPFASSTIVVCDHHAPRVSVWTGRDGTVAPAACHWTGPGFVDVYSRCAAMVGFTGETAYQRFEALAQVEETVWQKIWRFILGLFGLDSSSSSNTDPGAIPPSEETVPVQPIPGKG